MFIKTNCFYLKELKEDEVRDNLLMITDILAACALGENAGTESVCCTVFSVEEVIDIISDNNIDLHFKRPFMKFLISVYIGKKTKAEILKHR